MLHPFARAEVVACLEDRRALVVNRGNDVIVVAEDFGPHKQLTITLTRLASRR